MRIAIANDHRGLELKQFIKGKLNNKKYIIDDLGADSTDSVNYPDYAYKLSETIINNKNELGILICGTGIGMSIAANKVKGIRCAKVSTIEEAFLSRSHNDANVIAIGADLSKRKAAKIVMKFLETPFSNDKRHADRVNIIKKYEEQND